MLDLMLAAALMQTPDPCNAVEPAGPRPGHCPRWEAVHRVPESEMFIDLASLRRTGATFELVSRVIFVAEREGGVRSANIRYRYDCTARTVTSVHLTAYSAGGVQLTDGTPGGATPRVRPVPPDTVYARLLTRFCPERTGG